MSQNIEREERLKKRSKQTAEKEIGAKSGFPTAPSTGSSSGGSESRIEPENQSSTLLEKDYSEPDTPRDSTPQSTQDLVSGMLAENIHERMVNLQELSHLLSIANENTFGSSTSCLNPGKITRNLIKLISEPPTDSNLLEFELHPDILLLSYRCLYNFIEADPGSIMNFCSQNGVEALISKLMQIEYIDLAEQILGVLEKISVESPNSILKANGLFSILQYLDFHSTHVQRICIQIVANVCVALPYGGPSANSSSLSAYESLTAIMDIIVRIIHYSDHKIVETATLALSRIAGWSSKDMIKFEQLFSKEHSKSVVEKLNDTLVTSNDIKTARNLTNILAQFCKSKTLIIHLASELYLIDAFHRVLLTYSTYSNPSHVELNICIVELMSKMLPALPKERLFQVQPSNSQNIREVSDAELKLLHFFHGRVIEGICDLFSTSGLVSIRKCAITLVLKILWFSVADEAVAACFRKPKFLEFLVDLIALKEIENPTPDDFILSIGALILAQALFDKFGDSFMQLFLDNGYKNSIISLFDVVKSNYALNHPDDNFDLTYSQFTKLYYIERNSMETDQDDAKELQIFENSLNDLINRTTTVIVPWTTERVAQKSLLLRIFMFGHEQHLTLDSLKSSRAINNETFVKVDIHWKNIQNLGSNGSNSILDDIRTELLQELKEISTLFFRTSLEDGLPGLDSNEELAEKLCDMFLDFLSSSNDIKGHKLLNFCTKTEWTLSVSERISIFCEAFDRISFDSLVKYLNDHIRRAESLKILSVQKRTQASFAGRTISLLSNLTKHVKLSLEAAKGSDFPNSMRSAIVTIPVVSSLKTVESYLKRRLRDLEFSSPQIQNEIEELDLEDEGEAESDEGMEESPKKAKLFKVDLEHPEKFDEVFFDFQYGNQNFGSEKSILYVLSNSKGVDFDFTTIWDTKHTLHFSKCKRADQNSEIQDGEYCCECEICDKFEIEKFEDLDSLGSIRSPVALVAILEKICSDRNSVSFRKLLINEKLQSKLEKQIFDPLVCISDIYPRWAVQLITRNPYFIPFQLRLKIFLHSALGQSRNLKNWLSSHQAVFDTVTHRFPSLTRFDRAKLVVSRQDVFETMSAYLGTKERLQSELEVEFIGEAGTGLGPTMEFFSLVSKAIRLNLGVRICCKENYQQIWRTIDKENQYINPQAGLYPRPQKDCEQSSKIFHRLGLLVAKAILDSRPMDLIFEGLFIEQVFHMRKLHKDPLQNLCHIKDIDSSLYQSLIILLQMNQSSDFKDLCLEFKVPGYPEYEISDDPKQMVTQSNVKEFVAKVVDATIGKGVKLQIRSFRAGFNELITSKYMQSFTVEEIETILCGERNEDWTIESILQAVEADHGYSTSSRIVQDFARMLSNFSSSDRRQFMKFCTGSPKLPLGGFRALDPKLKIVRKISKTPDTCLPSVMTCAHYLKVPEYSSQKLMTEKFLIAIYEGQGSFHLS